jgi:putative transposase
MGIEAIYRKPNTSKPAPGHRIYPYLLRGLPITRPNQVWAMDITYIPMARGFIYLAAVVDWFTRRVLAWKLSITMESSFCIEALDEAFSRNEKPEIFNTDQGSQFTSEAFAERLKEEGIRISMDGKGRWRDNVFVERVWKSIKYEEVYLHAYETVHEARASRIFWDSAAGFFQILAAAAMLKGLMGSNATRAASSRVKSTSRMRKSSSEGGAPCGNRLSRSVSDL